MLEKFASGASIPLTRLEGVLNSADNNISFSIDDFVSKFNDIDGNPLTKIQITALPTNGILKLGSNNIGLNQEVLAADLSTLIFTPKSNFKGSDSFGWNGFDGTEYALTGAIANLAILSVNDLPTDTNDTAQTPKPIKTNQLLSKILGLKPRLSRTAFLAL